MTMKLRRDLDLERRVRVVGDVVRMHEEGVDGTGQIVVVWSIDPEALEFLLDVVPATDRVHADLVHARELARDVLWRKAAGRS